MPASMQRKYIDLIREASSKWVNWDPPIEIRVSVHRGYSVHSRYLNTIFS